jgi:hypothetical protein
MNRTPARATQADRPEYIRLAEAGEPYGLSAAALRAEAKEGRLAIYRLRGKDWTTAQDIREMFERCRVAARTPIASGQPSGSSGTPDVNSALASALATVDRLRLGPPPILPKNTSPRASAADDRREQPDIPNAPRSDPPASRKGAGKGMSRRAPAALS